VQANVKPKNKVFHTRRGLAARWNCSTRTVARAEKSDPAFPPRIRVSDRHFVYEETAVEQYERARTGEQPLKSWDAIGLDAPADREQAGVA